MKEDDFRDCHDCFNCEVRDICEDWTKRIELMVLDKCEDKEYVDTICQFGEFHDLVYQQPCYLESYNDYIDCKEPIIVLYGKVITIKFE